MNGDGKPDLAVANFSGHGTDFSKDAVNILYGDGTGRFRRGPKLTTGHCPVMIAAGDVDGDGAPDVAVANMCGIRSPFCSTTGGALIARTLQFAIILRALALHRSLPRTHNQL